MLKVAVIGPESTGKTELCRKLAVHFHGEWVPELARDYVEQMEYHYTCGDVWRIARLQIEQEKKYERKTKPDYVNERLASRFFDFYMLCLPDIPWECDPVRENGENRDFFLNWYENEIIDLGTPFARIGGTGEDRLQNALQAVKIYETNHTNR